MDPMARTVLACAELEDGQPLQLAQLKKEGELMMQLMSAMARLIKP